MYSRHDEHARMPSASHKPSEPRYPPPPTHVPVQQPSADPFPRRDPFLPAAQHSRNGSAYGPSNGTMTHQTHANDRAPWANPSAPPPPPSHQQQHHLASYGQPTGNAAPEYMPRPLDNGRPPSIGAGSPPAPPGRAFDHSPPSAPSSRNMPPPSPAHTNNAPSSSVYASPPGRSGLPNGPSAFSGGRELPSITSNHRPGSSMSILSMLGDSSTSNNNGHRSHAGSPPSQPLGPSVMDSSSPRYGAAADVGQFRRFHTPDMHRDALPRSGSGQMVSSGSPSAASAPMHTRTPEPMRSAHGGPPLPPSSAATGFRSFAPSPYENGSSYRSDPFMPRPSSQPTRHGSPPRISPSHSRHGPPDFTRSEADASRTARRNSITHASAPEPTHVHQSRNRANTMHPTSHSIFSPPRPAPEADSYRMRQPFPSFREGPSPNGTHLEQRPPPELHAYREAPPPPPSYPPSQSAEHPSYARPVNEPYPSRPTYESHPLPPDPNYRPRPDVSAFPPSNDVYESQSRGYPDAAANARLNVSPVLDRRGARSPIPQAVQGASTQPVEPKGDPAVKHEFGRPFSGLGVGMGRSTPPIGGMGTPTRGMSPARFGVEHRGREGTPGGIAADLELNKVRERSRGPKKGKRSQRGEEMNEGRNTPIFTTGRKKPRLQVDHGQAQHNQHDEFYRLTPTGFSTLKFPSAGQQTYGPSQGPNFAVQMESPQPVRPSVTPTIKVDSSSLLDGISSLPRRHLGSVLYQPKIGEKTKRSMNSIHSSALLDPSTRRRMYAQRATPLPRDLVNGRANCTITVRIGRTWLAAENRRKAIEERRVWGTHVYTDDSDVVAALVHSGWIRGSFAPDVDVDALVEMSLAQRVAAAAVDAAPPATIVRKPSEVKKATADSVPSYDPPAAGPLSIPTDKDLHATLLLLPALQTYANTTRFGVKSRKWGDSHDGMSFVVMGVEFVDERESTSASTTKSGVPLDLEARTAEARHERLHRGSVKHAEVNDLIVQMKRLQGLRGRIVTEPAPASAAVKA